MILRRAGEVCSGGNMGADESAVKKERRRHERFPCEGRAEVAVFNPDLLFRGEVKDISLTGCYIETRARLTLKRHAEIELRFSANGQHLSSLARVMDIRPGKGVGIEFRPGDPRMDRQVRELIQRLSLDASSEEGKQSR
jgi:hypothetical protein